MFSAPYLFWSLYGAALLAMSTLIAAWPLVRTARGALLKGLIVSIAIGLILGYAIAWLFMPTTILWDLWQWIWWAILLSIGTLIGSIVRYRASDEYGDGVVGRPIVMVVLVFVLLGGTVFVTSWGGFHGEEYAKLVEVRTETRDRTLPLVDQSQARLVTSPLAIKRAAELMSTFDGEALGSRVVIGEMWGNVINGKLVWAAALDHRGFGQWSSFGTTPGYVMVSQSNESDARMVTDRPIRYSESAWFGTNIYRHLYENGFSNYVQSQAVLQIDDDGRPYWLMILMQPQVGFGGNVPVRWALVDAETGVIATFEAAADLPEWVDRAYPQEVIADRFDDRSCWGQGWVACAWSSENVIVSTPGVGVTMDPAGKLVFYSGTQFKGTSNGATSGMFIADARTGVVTYYRRAGITEDVARDVITQGWANYGYKAADPIPLVLGDGEAYFSVVVDTSGSRKGFGVVSMQNRNVFGVGDSIQSAVSAYNVSLRRAEHDAALDQGKPLGGQAFYGIVRTIMPVISNGKTLFYVTLVQEPGRIFEIGEEKVGEFVATQVGDPVRIEALDASSELVYSVAFDNLRLTFSGMGPDTLDEQGEAVFPKPLGSGSFGAGMESREFGTPAPAEGLSGPLIHTDAPRP